MGSFSVACGITKLTITGGEKCALLPIITPRYYNENGKFEREDYATAASTCMFLDAYDLWEPFCFPILGRYNDYGSLENIEKDKNTELLEKHFGLSIEKIVELITENRRNPYDRYSSYNIFLSNPEDMKQSSSWKQLLNHIATKNDDGSYSLEHDFTIVLKGSDVEITHNGITERFSVYQKDNFLERYSIDTKTYPGVSEENLSKLQLFMRIGGMFIHRDAYEFYAKNNLDKNKNIIRKFKLNTLFLSDLGFVKTDEKTDDLLVHIYAKEVNGNTIKVAYEGDYGNKINGETVYSLDDFIKKYEAITGEKIDLSKYDGVDYYEWNKMEQKHTGIEKPLRLLEMEKFLWKGETFPEMNDIDGLREFLSKNYKKMFSLSSLSFVQLNYILKTYDAFNDIYTSEIIMGNMLDEFYNFARLDGAIRVSNVMYMPTYCGPQCGSLDAENKLAYITNRIVKKRIEEYLDENDDVEFDPNQSI